MSPRIVFFRKRTSVCIESLEPAVKAVRVSPNNVLRGWHRTFLSAILVTGALFANAQAQRKTTAEEFTQDFDFLWLQLRDNYAYFDKKQTDWDRVREFYRPKVSLVTGKREFVTLLEAVLDELYDPHTHLKINTPHSTRLIPTGSDVWAEWKNGTAVITQLRPGFSAEQSGLKAGMQIVAINGVPVSTVIHERLGVGLKVADDSARSWALRALLAGRRDSKRAVAVRQAYAAPLVYQLDRPGHTTVDAYQVSNKVEWKWLHGNYGYIKINDLGSDDTVSKFDAALEGVKASKGLIVDLRNTPSGGNTSVAEPILGRFIEIPMPYQKGRPRRGSGWTRQAAPRSWAYTGPVVVLVNRWTASMGEGIAIGLDGMKRAVIVGTPMAGLNGAVFNLQLPNTKIGVNYAAEKLFHLDGTPREDFTPPVLVKLTRTRTPDPILEQGVRTLAALARRKKPVANTRTPL